MFHLLVAERVYTRLVSLCAFRHFLGDVLALFWCPGLLSMKAIAARSRFLGWVARRLLSLAPFRIIREDIVVIQLHFRGDPTNLAVVVSCKSGIHGTQKLHPSMRSKRRPWKPFSTVLG